MSMGYEDDTPDDPCPDQTVWQSYVWYHDKPFFVSTIWRDFHAPAGTIRAMETLVWEYDWIARQRGKLIHQAGGLVDHQSICRSLIADGKPPEAPPDWYA